MQLTTENNDVFINLWNENKPDGFVHPMRKGVADIIFYALELAEYTVNFENDVLSLYDNQTNEDLGNKSLKDIFDKAYSICDTDYPDDTTSSFNSRTREGATKLKNNFQNQLLFQFTHP